MGREPWANSRYPIRATCSGDSRNVGSEPCSAPGGDEPPVVARRPAGTRAGNRRQPITQKPGTQKKNKGLITKKPGIPPVIPWIVRAVQKPPDARRTGGWHHRFLRDNVYIRCLHRISLTASRVHERTLRMTAEEQRRRWGLINGR